MAKKVKNLERRNPRQVLKPQEYDRAGNLDVLALHARAATKTESEWKGGDREDRLFYVQAQKKAISHNLERILAFSSKRTTH